MTNYYDHKGFSKPGVTSIISDCNDKSNALLPWATKAVCEWIRKNCDQPWLDTGEIVGDEGSDVYFVFPDDLDLAQKNYRDISDEALDIGSQVHKAVENWLKWHKEPINPREEVLAGFVAFLEFYDEHDMDAIELEFPVYGDYWGGTLDYYGMFNGKIYVIDFKTSKAHYIHEHGPQIAAYRSAVKTPCDGCGVLRLDKTTGYPDFKDYSKRYEKDLREFQLMVPLYLHRHPRIAEAAGFESIF